MMTNPLGSKIAELRKKRNLTQDELAKAIGKSKSTVAMWETGQRDPDTQMLVKLSEFFNVTTDRLLGTYTNTHLSNHLQRIDSKKSLDPVAIEVYGEIKADGSKEFIGFQWAFVDQELLGGSPGFAFRVPDESMSGDRIKQGDIAIAVEQNEVDPYDIAVVSIENEPATLKRVKKEGEMYMLIPSNPLMHPDLVPVENVNILGKVVEVKFSV